MIIIIKIITMRINSKIIRTYGRIGRNNKDEW